MLLSFALDSIPESYSGQLGEEDEESHSNRVLVFRDMNTVVMHVFREGNRCADKLAKLRGMQSENAIRILVPLEELIEDLRADMQQGHVGFFFFFSFHVSTKKIA